MFVDCFGKRFRHGFFAEELAVIFRGDKHGAIHKDNFDISDAYLIARYSFDQQQQQQPQQQRHPQPASEVE
jgi:hypothetical protein